MSEATFFGADAVIKVLESEQVDVIFGFPGAAVIPIYDRLYHAEAEGRIHHVLTRHEQGAVHAADGYARATGKVGVCIATSGPGAMNLITGIATAYMDSVPLVALTGQVRTGIIGKDAFQEADTFGVTMPITKHNYLVKDAGRLAEVLREAFYIARTGRPGPVLVDIPVDLTNTPCEWHEDGHKQIPGYNPPGKGDPEALRQAAELISKAERPVLYVGGGVIASGASDLVRQLAEKASLYTVHTLMAKGAFPEDHELSMGMPGMHGTAYATHAMHHAGLIISVGARFDDRVTGDPSKFAPEAEVIHIDIDPAEINKVRRARVGIVGDAREVLEELLPLVKPRRPGEWEAHLKEWRADHPLSYNADPEDGVSPQYVIEQLWEATKGEAVVCTEVGQHQMWAAQYYRCRYPRQFISSGGLGTMGYGFPAAIGAQIGCPDRTVVDIAGDGSIQMCIQELATAVIQKLPVKIVILNNGYLGMVRQWQDLFYGKRYSGVDLSGNPDFVKLAEAYSAAGFLVTDKAQVRPTLDKAMQITDRPCLIDVHTPPEENVFPMIPAGKTFEDMMETAPVGV
ncbi:biosynthetic-type acetolactate synthase large subunit [bacterium]|nr:biosynthetic-type acetolactate synthase large subunit [bacterium]